MTRTEGTEEREEHKEEQFLEVEFSHSSLPSRSSVQLIEKPMKLVIDVQALKIVEVDDGLPPPSHIHAEVLVVGGGLGGVAATLSACRAGRTVCLVEETDWLGGQATSQGVSALDENQYIETSGGTRSYLAFRKAIRNWYRRNTPLKPEAAKKDYLNPGSGWVSRLCFEPKAALAVIDDLLAPFEQDRRLRILKRCKAYQVGVQGFRVTYVDLVNLDTHERFRATADYVIDATELGDLLALGAADFVTGAESRDQTGEPAALDAPDPEDVQSFTYPFAIEHCPGERHEIPKPAGYEENAKNQPYSLVVHYKQGPRIYGMFKHNEGTFGPFWTYRRLIDAAQFNGSRSNQESSSASAPKYPDDIAMINWPGNDYRGGNILVNSPEEQIKYLRAARDLSFGLLYWLQHEVDRDDGGKGYPEFKLRADVMGTSDGLSKFPYIRESRRIFAVKTILEPEVTPKAGVRAVHFPDSVGIGLYGIDIHESKSNRKQVINPTKPFQIPLGALIPKVMRNVLAACKNIGTTHITNGCYRLHPVEWNIGESGGELAAFCVEKSCTTHEVRARPDLLLTLQRRLVQRGVPIMWYDDVPVNDNRFERIHMLPFEKPEVLNRMGENLHAP